MRTLPRRHPGVALHDSYTEGLTTRRGEGRCLPTSLSAGDARFPPRNPVAPRLHRHTHIDTDASECVARVRVLLELSTLLEDIHQGQ